MQAFSSATIQSGFRATSLNPFNLEEVLGGSIMRLNNPTVPGSD